MPIQSSDIAYRLSGGASNSVQSAALGGAKSSNLASSAIFPDLSGAQCSAGVVLYRCIYVHNGHSTLTALGATLWVQTNTLSPDTTADVGVGTSAINGTEQTVASETTAPTGVTFSAPTTYGSGLALGDIPAGQHRAVWLRLTVNAGAATYSDGLTLRMQCDTLP